MTPWQKRARLVIAVIGIIVLALVVLTIRERPSDEGAQEIARVDPKAVKESSGGVHRPMEGADAKAPIAFRHMLEYPDGTARLIDFRAEPVRDGRPFVITGGEAIISADRSHMQLTGGIRLASGDDLVVETSDAEYNQSQGVMRTTKPVRFRKGAMSGTSVGMTYHEERDLLALLDEVQVKAAAADGRAGADIRAGFAEYARADRHIRFERDVRVVRAGQVMTAKTALARLTATEDERLEALELYGGARIETPDAAAGGLQAMESEEMNLAYAADGETLERAILTGRAVIVEAAPGGGARRISAAMIDLRLLASGGIEGMDARERVQLTLPARGEAPERIVRSASMRGSGGAGGGLSAAHFEGGVEFRERRGEGGDRVGRSRTLQVALAPETGEIEEAVFDGSARFEDGTTRTASDAARYDVARGTLQLTGSKGRDPQVEDDRLSVEAERVGVGFDGPALEAEGSVRSVLRPARGGTNGQRDRAVPGMLKDDQPVYVTAARLQYAGGDGLATYTGGARLWQGETTIQGHVIVLDEKSGNLTASVDAEAAKPGLVRSAFVLDDRDEATGEVRRVPSTAAGRSFVYEDELRRATYTTEARVTGPQGDVQADRIELYFVEGGGSLERAEAYDGVRLRDEARSAAGQRLTFFGQEGRYVMTGTPVKIVRECDETLGKTLTFWRSTDRILVDGNQENRTQTKTGGTCAEQRRK